MFPLMITLLCTTVDRPVVMELSDPSLSLSLSHCLSDGNITRCSAERTHSVHTQKGGGKKEEKTGGEGERRMMKKKRERDRQTAKDGG